MAGVTQPRSQQSDRSASWYRPRDSSHIGVSGICRKLKENASFLAIFSNSRSIISNFDYESECSFIFGGRGRWRLLRLENFRDEEQEFTKCYAHPEGISCEHCGGLSVSVKLRDFLDFFSNS
jgi:hypothetical protein